MGDTYALSQVFGNLPQTNSSVRPDPGLFVIGSPRKKLEQFAIDYSVTELVYYCQYSLHGLLSHDRGDISEARSL